MKKFEKSKIQIILIFVAYVTITSLIGLSAFDYLKPRFLSYNLILGISWAFNIIAAILVYIYTNRMFGHAGNLENTYELLTDEERKEKEEKMREQQEKEMQRHRAEESNKMISEKVEEIATPIEDEIFPENYFDHMLINISKTLNIVQGVAYTLNRTEGKYEIKSTYAYYTTDTSRKFEIGEGITGQVAKDQKILMLDAVPQDYIHVVSGLGTSSPNNLIVIPIVHDDETIAVMELASFEKPTMDLKKFHTTLNGKISAKVAELLK